MALLSDSTTARRRGGERETTPAIGRPQARGGALQGSANNPTAAAGVAAGGGGGGRGGSARTSIVVDRGYHCDPPCHSAPSQAEHPVLSQARAGALPSGCEHECSERARGDCGAHWAGGNSAPFELRRAVVFPGHGLLQLKAARSEARQASERSRGQGNPGRRALPGGCRGTPPGSRAHTVCRGR